MSLFLFTTALSSALAEILIPAVVDPHLIVSNHPAFPSLLLLTHYTPLFQWVWAGPAIALFVQTAIFVWRHRGVNDDAYMTYESDSEAEQIGAAEEEKKES